MEYYWKSPLPPPLVLLNPLYHLFKLMYATIPFAKYLGWTMVELERHEKSQKQKEQQTNSMTR